VDTWEAGQGLELVARWGADGTLTAWYAVDAGTFIKMEQLDVTGNGLMSALPPRLLIGARNDQSGRAAGTYESVTFWKRAWSGDTPWRLFAARRPVWRNYYGRGELLSAEFEPDRPVLSRHLWRVTVNLRSV
jgi:hypothetical protein